MAKTISFNTGRKYTAHGQRIVATLHDDGVVTFMDHDRQINGEYVASEGVPLTQAGVMAMYDSNEYRGGNRSWADGMMRDGVNTLKA